jgi:hypothetical protein
MSDTNRVGLYIARNAERDPPITLSPAELRQLRYTGTPGLAFAPNSVLSQEIREDRQIPDSILVGANAGGSANFEMSYGTFDILIESAMLSTWVETPTKEGATEISAVGAGTITLDAATDFQIGHIGRFTHVDVAGDTYDNAYEVTNIATSTLTLAAIDGGPAISAGTSNANTRFKVCGLKAQANTDISVSVGSGIATFTFPAGFVDDAMGSGSPLVIGQWIKCAGFATAANNIAYRITGVDTGADTVTAVAQTGVATDAATTEQVEVFFGDYIRNGTDLITSHQFAIERRYTDHALNDVTRELFTGMAVQQMQINLSPQSIMTGQFTFLGLSSLVDDTGSPYAALYSGGLPTDVAAEDFDVYNTSTNVGRLALGADDITSGTNNLVLESVMTFNNNLRERPAVGVFGASSIGVGQLNVGGNLNTYFDDKTILDLILGNTDTEYNVLVQNSDGRSLLFDLPRVKLVSGGPEVAGANQDVVLNPDIQALRDPTLTYTCHIQRWEFIQ